MLNRTIITFLFVSFMAYSQASADNAGIYTTKKIPDLKPLLSSLAPSARITERHEGDTTTISCVLDGVTLNITIDPHWDPHIQLAGIKGWISRFPADERQTPAVASLFRKMDSTVDCLGCVITPRYDPDGRAAVVVIGLASKLDGYIFSHQTLYDSTGSKIIGLPGDPTKLQPTK